jgi:hypothetical protein
MAVCPGALTWSVEVSAAPDPEGTIVAETAELILASSKCCTAPMGVSRVGERYIYRADQVTPGSQTIKVLAGQKVTGIAAIGLPGGGYIDMGGDTITIPESAGMNLEPGVSLAPNSSVIFTNVSWVIEYLESA